MCRNLEEAEHEHFLQQVQSWQYEAPSACHAKLQSLPSYKRSGILMGTLAWGPRATNTMRGPRQVSTPQCGGSSTGISTRVQNMSNDHVAALDATSTNHGEYGVHGCSGQEGGGRVRSEHKQAGHNQVAEYHMESLAIEHRSIHTSMHSTDDRC